MRDGVPAKLRAACPDLYPEGSPHCGFSCPDAWLPTVERLSIRLQELIDEMPVAERSAYRCDQVKSKFGFLRVYLSRETPEMTDAIEFAGAEVARLEQLP